MLLLRSNKGANQRIDINGRNLKVASGVPFVGLGSRFIRGSDSSVGTATETRTKLTAAATAEAAHAP